MAQLIGRLIFSLMGAVCLAASVPQAAFSATTADLVDPTRPPPLFDRAKSTDTETGTNGPVLQSVMISSEHRIAIISGHPVKVGEKFGDAYVVRISESEVVLRTGKDLQVLKLFPGIDKKFSPRHAESATKDAARTK